VSVETLLTFVLASTLLSLAPGPDNIFVLLQSALHGRKAGLMVTLGLCTGLLVHTALVAAGVAALLLLNPVAFNGLKILGALYLVYLAIVAWQAASGSLSAGAQPELEGWQLYRRGIIMNLSNPKVGIFFLAFLPQFTAPEAGNIALQIIMLGSIFIYIAWAVFSAIALLADRLASWFRRTPGAHGALNRIAAVVFAALGIRLLLLVQ
jgi:threonine/homoserine/homoserine lactone efflux protein